MVLEMNYLLVFYTGNEIKRVTLRKSENITVGSGDKDTVKINNCGLEAGHLSFRHIDGGINILARTPFEIIGETAVNRVISAGDTLKINPHVILTVFENCCDFENVISLNNLMEIKIGRSSKNDIVLKGTLVSSSHAVLRNLRNRWIIKDKHSRNGIFVDDKLVTSENFELHDDAVIFIGGFVFEFRNNALKFKNTPGNVIISSELINSVTVSFSPPKSYPLFYL